MHACVYVISATSSPSSKGDVPSITESKDTKSVNLDGSRCSHLEYLPESIANSACDVVSMGVCGGVTVASSVHHCRHQQSLNHVLLVSYSLLMASAPMKRYAVHLSVHHLDECS